MNKYTVNLSRAHLFQKLHPKITDNDVIISINYPGYPSPIVIGDFVNYAVFSFSDSENEDNWFVFLDEHATRMAKFISENRDKNIWVQCYDGFTRSGAIVLALSNLGWYWNANDFEFVVVPQPNWFIYNKLKKALNEYF